MKKDPIANAKDERTDILGQDRKAQKLKDFFNFLKSRNLFRRNNQIMLYFLNKLDTTEQNRSSQFYCTTSKLFFSQ
jgi:hypothetical protein